MSPVKRSKLSGQRSSTQQVDVLSFVAQAQEVKSNQILAKLDSIADSLNEHKQVSGERMKALEINLKAIIGNGQPGRLGIAEKRISDLSESTDQRFAAVNDSISAGKGFFSATKMLIGAAIALIAAAAGSATHWLLDGHK